MKEEEGLLRRIPEYGVDEVGGKRDLADFMQGYSLLPIRFAVAG